MKIKPPSDKSPAQSKASAIASHIAKLMSESGSEPDADSPAQAQPQMPQGSQASCPHCGAHLSPTHK